MTTHTAAFMKLFTLRRSGFLTEEQMRIYMAPGEAAPVRVCMNKNHLVKVMFLSAIARPRYDVNGVCTFDGKIGMWPLIE